MPDKDVYESEMYNDNLRIYGKSIYMPNGAFIYLRAKTFHTTWKLWYKWKTHSQIVT